MKYLLVLMMLAATNSSAQSLWQKSQQIVAPENYSQSLESKGGFQDIILGRHISSFTGKSKAKPQRVPGKIKELAIYGLIKPSQYNIGDIIAKTLIVSTFRDTIYSVSVSMDRSRLDDLLKVLIETYGQPELPQDHLYWWESENVTLKLIRRDSIGEITMLIESKPISKRMELFNSDLSAERAKKL